MPKRHDRNDINLPSTEPAALRRWVLHICKRVGITPTELAREAKLAASTLNRFVYERDGGQKNLGGTTLTKLRMAANRLLADNKRAASMLEDATGWVFATVEVIGAVEAGDWRETPEWDEDDRYLWPVPISAPFASMKVVGLEVRGDDADQDYPKGSIVICVSLAELERTPQHGERVIVHRQNQGGLTEATIKEYRVDDQQKAWLWYKSDRPEYQKPIAYGRHGATAAKNISIPYIVIGCYRPERLTAPVHKALIAGEQPTKHRLSSLLRVPEIPASLFIMAASGLYISGCHKVAAMTGMVTMKLAKALTGV